MRQMLLVLLSAFCSQMPAQITITAATFPAVGDTLHTAIDLMPSAALITAVAGAPGGSKEWDFSGLKASQTDITVFKAVSAGTNSSKFPGSDLVVLNAASETYYNKTTTRFENLGYVGSDNLPFGLTATVKYSPAFVERRAPLKFFDINQQSTNLTLPFSTKNLPDSIKNLIPGNVDSFRIRISLQRLEVVDAWGAAKMPDNKLYNVLREKQTEYRSVGMDLKVPFLGWVDLSGFLGGTLGGLIGTDTVISYRFLNDKVKEDLAVATLSNDLSSIERVQFKDVKATIAAPEVEFAPGDAAVQAFPNPAIDWVRFDCTNLQADDYTLKIFSIIGKEVWKETYRMAGNKSIRVELDDFKKGAYLYSLVDGKGKTIGTKRLVILKP